MRYMLRALGTSVVVSLFTVVMVGAVTVADASAQVAQPDYGAGPGVGAGAPRTSDPPSVLNARPTVPGVGASAPGVQPLVPGVRANAPGVQGAVPATTLPRTGGTAPEFTMSWQLAALGVLLIVWLGVVGGAHARTQRTTQRQS